MTRQHPAGRALSPSDGPNSPSRPLASADALNEPQAGAERRERWEDAYRRYDAHCYRDLATIGMALADPEQQGLKSRAESAEAAHRAVWELYQARGERIFELQGENARLRELAAEVRAAALNEAADDLSALANRTTERGAGVLWAAERLRTLVTARPDDTTGA